MVQTLFYRNIQSIWKPWVIFAVVMSMYAVMIISMFDPQLGKSLQQMSESMPQLFAAFGMDMQAKTLIEFIANYLYGFLLVCLPMVFELIAVNLLMSRYIDRGSMAWLLSGPNGRVKICLTQLTTLILAVVLHVVFITSLCVVVSEITFPGELDIGRFLVLNLSLLGLQIFLSGLCFLGNCLFCESRYALGFGGGLSVLFLLLQMRSQVGEDWEFVKYFTPFTLFEAKAIALGEGNGWTIVVLYLMGILLYGAAMAIFSKRDLNL